MSEPLVVASAVTGGLAVGFLPTLADGARAGLAKRLGVSERTADYLEKVMVRITYVGAGFLALVAITPTIIAGSIGVDTTVASFYGGTGLLIVISVALDLIQKINSHLVMRNYPGLTED